MKTLTLFFAIALTFSHANAEEEELVKPNDINLEEVTIPPPPAPPEISFPKNVEYDSTLVTSLPQAMSRAYENNPELKKARAELESTNELMSQANSGFLPNVSGQIDYGRQRNAIGGTPFQYSDLETKSLQVSQPLFKGGETIAKLNRAENLIFAQRASLQATEQKVMLDSINAYMNLITDRALLDLNENNEKVLTKQFELTDARFEYGELSRTDVSQAKARLAKSTAEKISSETSLVNSRAAFDKIIGEQPGALNLPKDLPKIPDSLDKAIELAKNNNPQLIAAKHSEMAADADVDMNISEILPELSLEGSMQRQEQSGFLNGGFDSDQVVLRLSVPIFQSGTEYSKIRQSKKDRQAKKYESRDVYNLVIQETKTAWKNVESAKALVEANEAAVEAAEFALEGVQAEEELGSRSVLDVLDSQQELFGTKTDLIRAKRDQIIAYYALLDKIGMLTAHDLLLDTEYYDEEKHYKNVKYKFIGF